MRRIIAYTLLALALGIGFFRLEHVDGERCKDSQRQYDALKRVIVTSYAPTEIPSDVVIPPELQKLIDASRQQGVERGAAVLRSLGERPSC